MILPAREANHSATHVAYKAEADSSLKYQLEKLLHICKKLEYSLERQSESPKMTFSTEAMYSVDALISNFPVLIEYYYSWIVYSYIGTVSHEKKLEYKPIKATEKDDFIKDVFKKYSIGVLKLKEIDGFTERCKVAFLKAYDFLFIGKFHEIFSLNNFLKHNRILSGYAPKVVHKGVAISVPYIYVSKHSERLVKPSILKCFFENEIGESSKIISEKDDYYVKIFNATSSKFSKIGANNIYNVNGIDYLVPKESVGISVESMLEVTYELCLKIIDILEEADTSSGTVTLVCSLKKKINERKPKTLSNYLLNSDGAQEL